MYFRAPHLDFGGNVLLYRWCDKCLLCMGRLSAGSGGGSHAVQKMYVLLFTYCDSVVWISCRFFSTLCQALFPLWRRFFVMFMANHGLIYFSFGVKSVYSFSVFHNLCIHRYISCKVSKEGFLHSELLPIHSENPASLRRSELCQGLTHKFSCRSLALPRSSNI